MRTTHLFLLLLSLSIAPISYGQKKINIEQAVSEQYTTFGVDNIDQLQWVADTDSYSYVKDKTLYISTVKGKVKKVISAADIDRMSPMPIKTFPDAHWINADEFWFQNGDYYCLFSAKKKSVTTLINHNKDAENKDYHAGSNHLAYTIENDLYINSGKDEISAKNNEDPGIVSGQAIARSEFGIVKGTFWSPDGSRLAFYEKDERHVTTYPLLDYNTLPATVNPLKYPFSGSHSEYAAVGIYNVSSNRTIYLKLENGRKDDSFYATNLAWDPDNKHVYLAIVNRAQDHMWLKKYNAETGDEVATLFEETDAKYTEPENAPRFIPGSPDKFVWISEKDGYDNLYVYMNTGKLVGNTSFKFPITDFLGFDKAGASAFVQATGTDAVELHIFKINLKTLASQQITKTTGVHNAEIGNGNYIIDNWSNLSTPRKIDLLTSSGKLSRNLLTASNPREGYSMGTIEVFSMPAQDGTPLWCRLIKPTSFDSSKKYPVIVYVYNGPHVQLVNKSFGAKAPLWMNSMAEEGYLIFTVDGRGSGNRGRDFEQAIFRQLGTQEMDDQEFCVNWLKDQPYTDANRFAVHGWSYGGYMTSSMMMRKPGLFKVGVAGGPVTNWSYYEVMYTERYMDTPQENPDGYTMSNLKNHVGDLQGDLLIIHGSIDDVVVMQHSMDLLTESVNQGVQLDFYTYPMHPHNVRGKDRVHLMKKVLGYIMDRL
jgi:dipeptidyl-peptidase 4